MATATESVLAEDEIRPLVRLLKRARAFALAFVEINVPRERPAFVETVRGCLGGEGPGLRVLEVDGAEIDLYQEIQALEPPLVAGETIVVLGLEHGIPARSERTPTLAALQGKRELFRDKFASPIVVVLPEYALNRLAREAPDFWAWRSGVFKVGERRLRTARFAEMPPDSWQLASLTEKQKRRHLEVLRRLLEKLESTGAQERDRHDVLWRISRLRKLLGEPEMRGVEGFLQQPWSSESLGNRAHTVITASLELGYSAYVEGSFDEASESYREALGIAEELGDRANAARLWHHLGLVEQARGSYEEAMSWILRSLAMHLELGSPDARINLEALAELVADLGADRFREILAEHHDPAEVENVLDLLEPSDPSASPDV